MDLQFQGFLVHMQHKENREAFSYIVVFFVVLFVVVSWYMKIFLFFYNIVAFFKADWEAIVNITRKDSMYIVA